MAEGLDPVAANKEPKLCESNVVFHEGKLVVWGDGIKMAEVGSCARFSIFTGSNERQPKAILKSLVDESSQQLQVAPVGGGVYNVQYTPQKRRGQHHLLISVEDQPVPGSPFSVFVKIHPTKLDKPVKKIELGSIDPFYGKFNSSGDLILTDSDTENFFAYNKKEDKIQSISKLRDEFQSVCGVAVDKDDNIYICDSGTHCVLKFNKEGDLLKKFGEKGSGPNEFDDPQGIAVAGDRVLVCDRYNKRIQVLTTGLEPVKVIGGLHFPQDIAVDDKQMLYIADGIEGVKVFTMDGQFSCCFKPEELESAFGVCVDNETGFVYVSDYRNYYVCVFTRDGQFVTSFGSRDFISAPYGVTMDSDGFLYVFSSSALTVF